jgi:hypothetical protein
VSSSLSQRATGDPTGAGPRTEIGVWIYPWDVARLGASAVVEDLEAHGIRALNLAATYHPISAVSLRASGPRMFFCPSGAVFSPGRLVALHADQAADLGRQVGGGRLERAAYGCIGPGPRA